MYQIGLIILWPNHLNLFNDIMNDLSSLHIILDCYDIEWNKNNLYNNFYRFYGDKLSTSSIKEKTTSDGRFKLIIYKDSNPSYAFRTTAQGVEKVNKNFFDLKNNFRKKFSTRFGIHGSNDEIETNRDLTLLLGINLEDYKKRNNTEWDGTAKVLNRDITGINGWTSFEEFFYCMNAIEPYVILRNENLILNLPNHEDIDFLVYNHKKFAYFSNAKKLSQGTERVNYEITVSNRKIEVDFRYIGDNYFDQNWQKDCMAKRQLNKDNIYVLDEENAYYSLAYHAFIHKKEFPTKYLDYFGMPYEALLLKLYNFMHQHNYKMVEPKDITVNFTKKYGGDIKLSRERRLRNKKNFIGKIKKILNKLNHLLHFRKGPA